MTKAPWYNEKSMSKNTGMWADKRGMVSFLVTMIMMIVITLIVVGFSEVTRRNEREALDRQLSAQAFYAAESGINVTQKSIIDYVAANGYSGLSTKTLCPNEYDPTNAAGSSPIAALASGVQYTCVLVNPRPSSLQFSASQQASTILPVIVDGGLNLKTLTVSWSLQDGGSNTTCAGNAKFDFVPMNIWGNDCDLGVVRLDIVQNPSANATNAGALANNTITVFLTPRGPHDGQGTVNFGGSGSTVAYVISGKDAASGSGGCSSGACQARINFPSTANNYEIRATTLYKDSKTVKITGTTSGDTTAYFTGAQAVVDVTGKDQDELRRIQARIALTGTPTKVPANALSATNSICKHFSILPTDNLNLSTAGACN